VSFTVAPPRAAGGCARVTGASAASSVTRVFGDAAVADVLDPHLAKAPGGREPQQRPRTADQSVKRDEITAVHDVQ